MKSECALLQADDNEREAMNNSKLVRDLIPKIIKESGKKGNFTRVDRDNAEQRKFWLLKKMQEETGEFSQDPSLEEAADMYEVFLALVRNAGLTFPNVVQAAADKRLKRGAFDDGYILHSVEE